MCAMKQTGIIIPLVGRLAGSCMQNCSYVQCYVNINPFFFFSCKHLVLCNCFGSLLFSMMLIMEVHPSLLHPSIHPSLESSAALWLCMCLCRYFPFLTISDNRLIQNGIKLWLCHRAKTLNPVVKCYDSKGSTSIDKNIYSHRTFSLTIAKAYQATLTSCSSIQ